MEQDSMIEVTVLETGDSAEAETSDAALLAARTIGAEARNAAATWGFNPTLVFRIDGLILRTTTLRSLDREARS